MKSVATDAWSRFEKHDIRSYRQDLQGEMYFSPGGGWIWWWDFLQFMERNQEEEEHF